MLGKGKDEEAAWKDAVRRKKQIWGKGLPGVVTSFAMRNSAGFKSPLLHQKFRGYSSEGEHRICNAGVEISKFSNSTTLLVKSFGRSGIRVSDRLHIEAEG